MELDKWLDELAMEVVAMHNRVDRLVVEADPDTREHQAFNDACGLKTELEKIAARLNLCRRPAGT